MSARVILDERYVWQRAEDLVQTVLVRAYPRWQRLRRDSPGGYLRQMLVTAYLSWWRRRWRGGIPASNVPDWAGGGDAGQTELRVAVNRASSPSGHPQMGRSRAAGRLHHAIAALTARNTIRGDARSLRELNCWTLCNRP
jgi:DNA-directed RNA polymerase specialized sigma24 family protein